MGATGVKIVAANLTIVKAPGKRAYIRSKTNIVTSKRLVAFHSCIRTQMKGQHGSAADIQRAFASAASSCRGAGAGSAGRRMAPRRRFE